jgi:hypothetical protein
MKNRYIEIVFDNSGSMGTIMESGKSRLETAKQLFREEILPSIDWQYDSVFLRTLRSGCENLSEVKKGFNKDSLEDMIQALRPSGGTPLYNTVKDALNASKRAIADEKVIFVLTDGEDTCGFSNSLNFTEEELRYVKTLNVILIKYAIENTITNANLDWFASKIGAQTFSVGASGRADFRSMRADLRNGLGNAGFVTGYNRNVTPVYPNYTMSWGELNNRGIQIYQAELLFNEGFLSWKPEPNKPLEGKQWSELLFLWSLRFLNGLPTEIVRSMLSGLKRPYAFSQSGIYWDFQKTRWITPEAKPMQRLPNPEAKMQDNLNVKNREIEADKLYDEDVYYEVHQLRQENVAGTPGYKLIKWQCKTDILIKPSKIKKLKEGDVVQFVKPKAKGRPKKSIS